MGYSLNNRAYRVYDERIKAIMESIKVVVADQGSSSYVTRISQGPNSYAIKKPQRMLLLLETFHHSVIVSVLVQMMILY